MVFCVVFLKILLEFTKKNKNLYFNCINQKIMVISKKSSLDFRSYNILPQRSLLRFGTTDSLKN